MRRETTWRAGGKPWHRPQVPSTSFSLAPAAASTPFSPSSPPRRAPASSTSRLATPACGIRPSASSWTSAIRPPSPRSLSRRTSASWSSARRLPWSLASPMPSAPPASRALAPAPKPPRWRAPRSSPRRSWNAPAFPPPPTAPLPTRTSAPPTCASLVAPSWSRPTAWPPARASSSLRTPRRPSPASTSASTRSARPATSSWSRRCSRAPSARCWA